MGTELLVDGAVEAYPYIGVAVVMAAALNGIAIVKAYFLLFTGTRHVSSVSLMIRVRERYAVLGAGRHDPDRRLRPAAGRRLAHHAAEELLHARAALSEDPVAVNARRLHHAGPE